MFHVIYSKRNTKYAIVEVDGGHLIGYLHASSVKPNSWVQDLTLLDTLRPHQRGWSFLEWLSAEALTSILSFETTAPLDYAQNIYTYHPELLI